MALSDPVRINNSIYQAAEAAAAPQGRSTAQQIAHWARLGRAL